MAEADLYLASASIWARGSDITETTLCPRAGVKARHTRHPSSWTARRQLTQDVFVLGAIAHFAATGVWLSPLCDPKARAGRFAMPPGASVRMHIRCDPWRLGPIGVGTGGVFAPWLSGPLYRSSSSYGLSPYRPQPERSCPPDMSSSCCWPPPSGVPPRTGTERPAATTRMASWWGAEFATTGGRSSSRSAGVAASAQSLHAGLRTFRPAQPYLEPPPR